MARQVIGIDFGTTYSSIALMDIGSSERPRLLEFRHASSHAPTLLLLDPNDQSVISWGWEAQGALRIRQGASLRRYFKRQLGDDTESTEACRTYLSKLRERVSQTKNLNELSDADFITCIGVPANWPTDRCNKLKSIATEVGFPDIRLLPEPVAAMHNLRCQTERRFRFGDRPEKYMVVDFGGGTLDICIVRTDELGRNPETIATDGDPQLGGLDFDQIVETAFLRQTDIDISTLSDADQWDLRRQIQDAKEAFSAAFLANNVSGHYTIHLPGGDYPFSLSRVVFENLCRDQGILTKIEHAVERSLEKGGTKATDIRRVILTGGSSAWYFVKEIVSKKMGLGGGESLFYTETPYTDVACGLAIHIGRADEPPDKPGVWVRMKVDSEPWRDYVVVLHPGRAEAVRTEQRLHMGPIEGSGLLCSHRIELQWAHGEGMVPGARSVVKMYARSNHPRVEKLRKLYEVLVSEHDVKQHPDRYQVFLLYHEDDHGHPHYALEIQDNRDKCRRVTVVPGEDVRNTILGLGRPIRVDHVEHQPAEGSQLREGTGTRASRLMGKVKNRLHIRRSR